jgi:hypothetical protein
MENWDFLNLKHVTMTSLAFRMKVLWIDMLLTNEQAIIRNELRWSGHPIVSLCMSVVVGSSFGKLGFPIGGGMVSSYI